MKNETWKKRKLWLGIETGFITIAGMAVNAPYLIDGSPGWLNVGASLLILISWIVFASAIIVSAEDRRKAYDTISQVIGLILVLMLVLYLVCHALGNHSIALLALFYIFLVAPVSGIAGPLYMEYQQAGDHTYDMNVNSEDEIPLIVKRIVAAGGDIYHVSAEKMSLEEIYFSLIDMNHGETERGNL